MSNHEMIRYPNGVVIRFGTKSIFLGDNKTTGGVKIVFKRRLHPSERDKEFNQLGHWKTKSYKFCQVNLSYKAFQILLELSVMKSLNLPDPPFGMIRKLDILVKTDTFKKIDMDYEHDITIDESALDVEWLNQPRLMLKYIKHSAKTNAELDLAKERLDVEAAEIRKKIRESPSNYGIDKLTEGAVQEAMLTDKGYKEVNLRFLTVKYEAEIARGALRAFEQRKDSLENLVKLHYQSYFAGPKIPRNLSEERKAKEEDDQKMSSRINDKLKTRVRGR